MFGSRNRLEFGSIVGAAEVAKAQPGLVLEAKAAEKKAAPLTDDDAKILEAEWKKAFPDSSILPTIGLPSYKGTGVMTLTHTLGTPGMTINGLASRSPLANNALFSTEYVGGKYLNLYEIMLPDTPGVGGGPSRVEMYTKALEQQGLSVAGNHFHWLGAPGMLAIHHQSTSDITPLEFTARTIKALKMVTTGL